MYRHSPANDIKSPRLLYAKGFAFLVIGFLASILLLVESPRLYVLLLHTISIWAFARAYYFAFYVIEHYVDPSFRFSGLFAFVRYLRTTKTENSNSSGSSKQV
jgi:hypothetical protein